jgi:CheY-like chemotaxis protein
MDKILTPLIHYPTTTIFVDDNLTFLQSLSLLFPDDFPFQLFDSPCEALSVINAYPSTLNKQLAHNESTVGAQIPESMKSILFAREITDSQKYAEISVVVVDYTMPNMNGLDFCEKVANPLIKKVLFTGQADESIAVRAIERGVIDAYVLKSDSNVAETISNTVEKLKNKYFLAVSSSLSLSLNQSFEKFVANIDFQELLSSLVDSGKYVEHYYQTSPPGYLLFTRTGVCNRLVVYNQDYLVQFVSQYEKSIPKVIATAILDGEVIPYFPSLESVACDSDNFRWQTYLYPAKSFRGDIDYRYALIDNPKLQFSTNQVIPAYAAYLDEIDQEFFA